mmetsp:Transcript_12449/g.19784  ORF Transcript_12449/g.19784 Transcript_12449/m.19784 type:complete len:341 (-) Transcript_12449:1330-2352(-)
MILLFLSSLPPRNAALLLMSSSISLIAFKSEFCSCAGSVSTGSDILDTDTDRVWGYVEGGTDPCRGVMVSPSGISSRTKLPVLSTCWMISAIVGLLLAVPFSSACRPPVTSGFSTGFSSDKLFSCSGELFSSSGKLFSSSGMVLFSSLHTGSFCGSFCWEMITAIGSFCGSFCCEMITAIGSFCGSFSCASFACFLACWCSWTLSCAIFTAPAAAFPRTPAVIAPTAPMGPKAIPAATAAPKATECSTTAAVPPLTTLVRFTLFVSVAFFSSVDFFSSPSLTTVPTTAGRFSFSGADSMSSFPDFALSTVPCEVAKVLYEGGRVLELWREGRSVGPALRL